MTDAIDWDAPLEPNISNIVEQESLKWIFVGGKGGVGKTTTACSVAVTLAKHRESVLIISTDPAHNLSDAFGQKFGKETTRVMGFDNLFAMEIDPTVEVDTGDDALDRESEKLMAELISTVPGIDEAKGFAAMLSQVQAMNFSVVVLDTAPTGHTLRLLGLPTVLEKAFAKMMALRSKFSGIFDQVSGMLEQRGTSQEVVLERFEQLRDVVRQINEQFTNPDLTTFVCVCIPEFLSLFETERLVQELARFGIDAHNIIVNQVLMPEPGSTCTKCEARVRMQKKYLDQINDLYEDFHVTVMPLLDEEVRQVEGLEAFSKLLLKGSTPATRGDDV